MSAPVAAPAPAPRPRATGTPEDARRHMVRGMAAVEMAQSDEELAGAEEEFRIATEIDPNLAAAWFNLAAVQSRMGQLEGAIASYNRYLTLSPNADDALRVRDEVIKLEFRQEQVAKAHARAGTWVADNGASYQLTMEGSRMVLKTTDRPVREPEVISEAQFLGKTPVQKQEHAVYTLALQGNRLTGTWSREALEADKCIFPGDTAEVLGRLNPGESSMTLQHPRTMYRAYESMMSGGCSVTALDNKMVEEKLYGPLPKGTLGVGLVGLTTWTDGDWDFKFVRIGWQGRLRILVSEQSTAYSAGLRSGDEILAIDGTALRDMNAGQAMMRLYGEPGTPVTLTIWRKGVKEPFPMTVQRVVNR